MPEISVLLPVRDGAKHLALAMASVLEQSHADFELLVLDDGSRDATLDIARGFGDARVRVLGDGARRGISARLNQGIDAAAGRYIARMDADDVCWRERFARQHARLEAEAELDLVACRTLDFDARGRIVGLRPYYPDHAQLCARPWNGFYLVHPSWMARAAWFRRFRYAMPGLIRSQDQELLLRAYAQSRFAVLDEILFGYRATPRRTRELLQARACLLSAQLPHFARRGQWRYWLLALGAAGAKIALDLGRATRPARTARALAPSLIPAGTDANWTGWMSLLQEKLASLHLPPGIELAASAPERDDAL